MKAKGETLGHDVLHRMRDDILRCDLKPGDKLRFEALRSRYSVSFSTLREALARLVAERLVVSEGQRGFVVAPVSTDDLVDLTDTRVLLEREMLSRAMEKGDDDWEANILASYHRMDRMQARLGAKYYQEADWSHLHGQFHLALVSACGSPILLEMREQLFHRANRYRRMSSEFRTQWRPKEIEHKTIMDAVLERRLEALDLIERHFRETTENVLAFAQHLLDEPDAEPALRTAAPAG